MHASTMATPEARYSAFQFQKTLHATEQRAWPALASVQEPQILHSLGHAQAALGITASYTGAAAHARAPAPYFHIEPPTAATSVWAGGMANGSSMFYAAWNQNCPASAPTGERLHLSVSSAILLCSVCI